MNRTYPVEQATSVNNRSGIALTFSSTTTQPEVPVRQGFAGQ
jgi:hypothetical protein